MDDPDAVLMKRLAAGEDLALNELMARWGGRVTGFLLRMTGQHDVAVDLAQETFVKLYQARSRYRPSGGFSSYLFGIAANLARNHSRWVRRHPTVSMDAAVDQGGAAGLEGDSIHPSPADAAEAAEKQAIIRNAISELPEDLREAISLFVYERIGYAEIAKISGCSAKAVETRIYRARQILKERLKELRPV
jgi:RNA polymerase sigma-70 factor, ECF subfamily